MWKPWVEITGEPVVLAQARLLALSIYTKVHGHITMGVLYGANQEVTDEMPEVTKDLIAKFAQHARSRGKPFILLGDFNTTPEIVTCHTRQGFGVAQAIHTNTPTCFPSVGEQRTLEFALASAVIVDAVKSTSCLQHAPFSPHVPDSFALPVERVFEKASVFKQVSAGLPVAVFGPAPPPPHEWVDFIAKAKHVWGQAAPSREVIEGLHEEWEDLAHKEAPALFQRKKQAGG